MILGEQAGEIHLKTELQRLRIKNEAIKHYIGWVKQEK